jgi:hypothetical protein
VTEVAVELLEELQHLGVEAFPTDHGTLKVRPADRIPQQLLAELRLHRDELLALLQTQRAWSADPPQLFRSRRARVDEDPRPDLPGSELWARLLQLAAGDARDPAGTYGRLLGARACGAVLERRGDRWRLAPTLDPREQDSVWADRAAWEADAERWLRPRAQEVTRLLRQLPPPEGEA